jgi:hypothetical protein
MSVPEDKPVRQAGLKTALLLAAGSLLLVLAVAAHAVIGRFVRLETDPRVAPGLLELSRVALDVGGPRGGGRERRISVRVAYPEELRENEATSVELRYDEEGAPGEPPAPIAAAAELSSPAFEISPAQRIERRGVPPLTFTWVVKPESEGRYALLLDLDALPLEGDAVEVVGERVTLNGREVTMPEGDALLLRTRVFTVWGITGKTFGALRAGVGFLGFVLMYPLWTPWLQRTLGWTQPKGP